MLIFLDVGVHRAQEMRLLKGDGYLLLLKQMLVCVSRALRALKFTSAGLLVIEACKIFPFLILARARAKSWYWVGVDPIVQFDFAHHFSSYNEFYSVALQKSPGDTLSFSRFFISDKDFKQIGGSLFRDNPDTVRKDVISVDAEYFLSLLRDKFSEMASDYKIVIRMNCEGAEGSLIEAALKVFGSKVCLISGTLADVQKIFGDEELKRVKTMLLDHGHEILAFSPHMITWRPILRKLVSL